MTRGWTSRTLVEVCQIRPPKSEARNRLATNAPVSFLPMEDMGIGAKFVQATQTRPLSEVAGGYTYFANGDVLLAKITPCFENGKLGIAADLTNGVGFGSSEYIVFRPNATLSKDWLYYYLSREMFRTEGAARMSGAVGHKRVSKDFIEGYSIPIPPIAEQKRLVNILDEAFENIAIAVANAERNFQNVRSFFESYLDFVFRSHNETWEVDLLGKRVKFIDYRGKTPPKREAGVRLITAKNVKKGFIQNFPEEYVDPSAFDGWMTRGFPKRGDVLFTTEAPLGNVAQLDTDEQVMIGQRLITMQPEQESLDPSFLKFMLMSPPLQEEILRRGTGATVMGIKASLLKVVPIRYPRTISEQKDIVKRLEVVWTETQRIMSLNRLKLSSLDELRDSLLSQAFGGQLTNSTGRIGLVEERALI